MTSKVSGNQQNRMVRVNEMESAKKAKPGVFSKLKTWMKTRLYGSPFGGLLVRYGVRKAMAAVKKHTTAVTLLEYIERDINASKPKPSLEESHKGSAHDNALGVVVAQLKQARTNLEKAEKALSSKESDFVLLRSQDEGAGKNIDTRNKIRKSKSNLISTNISRKELGTLSKEIRATIKKEWDPGLFTRSAEQRKAMEYVRDIILDSLNKNESKLQLFKKTKGEKLESKSSTPSQLKPSVQLVSDFHVTIQGQVDEESIA